jgi:hypothetical protein
MTIIWSIEALFKPYTTNKTIQMLNHFVCRLKKDLKPHRKVMWEKYCQNYDNLEYRIITFLIQTNKETKKTNFVHLVRKRTILAETPPLAGEF